MNRGSLFSSWRVARIAGIDVSVHWTFFLLLAWISFSALSGGVAVALGTLVLVLAVFGCVLLHEFGHALAARQFGIETRGITLLPIGGVASLDRMPRKPLQELWIAVAGPLVNVAIAIVLAAALPVMSYLASPMTGLFRQLMWINVALVLFNMLPAFPLDGGRVLRAGLALFVPYVNATRTATSVGKVMAVGLGVLGFFYSPMLVLIAVFIFLAGTAEASMVEMQYGAGRGYHDVATPWAQPSDPETRRAPRVVVLENPDANYKVVYRSDVWPPEVVGWERG